MKRIIICAALAVSVLSMVSCKSQYEILLSGNDVEAKYKAAFEYFEKDKFEKASQLFESISMMTSGTERDDTVQYYWGLSNYRSRDYVTAEANFEKFIQTFPRSPFAPSAEFFRIDCLYNATYRYELDQTPTYKAISAISEYLLAHPEGGDADMCRKMLKDLGDRLDRKAYENAKLYYKMEDYKAARVALKNVLKDDSDNIYREDILYYIALSSYKYAEMSIEARKKERFMVFVDDYLNFVGEYPESAYRKELDSLYRKVKN